MALPTLPAADPLGAARDWIAAAITELCPRPNLTGFDAELALPGAWVIDEEVLPNASTPRRIRLRLALPEGGVLTLTRFQLNGALRQMRAAVFMPGPDGERPVMQAITDGACTIRAGQAIRHEGPIEIRLDQLDGDLANIRWTETLQTDWPEGTDRGGVRVALIDTGLAYDLPHYADRLARGPDGTPLGYDFWDQDPWPYDGDTSRSPFQPIRHGSAVASVLVREAPQVSLLPYRFPRPDMTRMGELVDRAARDGARVLVMPLGSNRPDDWSRFLQALDRHDILAVVSAGNDGRDIDLEPIYPAAFDHPRILTVTSSDGLGRLANGSNWGTKSVDIMLPAENLGVTDFRGASGTASGSSYAVPRLAAMAVRMLQNTPDMTAADLKAQVIGLAVASPYDRDKLAAGWIPNPLAE